MSNIVLISGTNEPSVLISDQAIRKYAMLRSLNYRKRLLNEVTGDDISFGDVFCFVRPQVMYEYELMKLIKRKDKFVYVIYDDDFLALKDFKVRRKYHYKAILKILKISDLIVASTKILGDKLYNLSTCKRVVLTDYYLEDVKVHERNITDTFKIAYYVSDGRTEYFDRVVRPNLKNLDNKVTERIEWYFIGLHPLFSEEYKHFDFKYVSRMPFDKFKTFLSESNFSLGIAPLFNSEFTSSKYVNKFVEYTCAGIPAIYSNVEPYSSFIKNGTDGILCEDSEWADAIIKMMDIDFSNAIFEHAKERLKRDFTEEKNFENNDLKIPEMVNYSSRHDEKISVSYAKIVGRIYVLLEFISRVNARLKIEGIGSTLTWIKDKYIKKGFKED